jgi:metallophosphoesterase superfamily enzyme
MRRNWSYSMNSAPRRAGRVVELAHGACALSSGVLWLHASRTLVAADVHFGYEDAIGAALPMWSTGEIVALLLHEIRTMGAREVLLLGDVIHSSRLTEGAAQGVRDALDALRAEAVLTIVAGNHEGRTRGAAILGETVESARRDGWLLLHGDKPGHAAELSAAHGIVIGHLHPSLALGGGKTAPAFLANDRLIVVPAMTPYSNGLDICSEACAQALRPFNIGVQRELQVVAATGESCYPFGALSVLRRLLSSRK